MSGIFGIVNFDGEPVHQADLKRISKTMAHRGPDAANVWSENAVGLGQLMLCSTKESLREPLPWEDSSSGLVITADARIDNRAELLAALSIDSEMAPTIPDSQLILLAFRKWDEACVDHLLGDFSFAIWDKRNRQLFIARDHMGIRPFYYYSSNEVFVFASAASAVAQASRVPNQINEGRVADFLIQELEGINKTSTFFEQVYRMPPAHFGVAEKKKLTFQCYWEPDSQTCLKLNTDDDYTDALEEVLTLSIKARLRSQYPASSMLSGGVDSSTISGIAGKLYSGVGGRGFRTYSAVSDDESKCCESSFIRLMIDNGDFDPVLLSPSEVKKHSSDFEKISEIFEDPFDESWTMLALVYLTAREHGNVVVMDGMGGDLVAGLTRSYPSYLLRQGEIKNALRETNNMRLRGYLGEIGWLKAYSQTIRPVITPNLLRHIKSLVWTNGWMKDSFKDSMLSKEFAKKIKLRDRWKEYIGQSTLGFCSSLREAHAETITVPYQTAAIERYERIASYCGVEARQPFFDKRVVELFLSMPWQQKAQNGWLKFCLRNVLQRVAPTEVAWRSEFDSIMWKFGVAEDAINHKKNISMILKNWEQLLIILDKSRLDQTLSKYTNGKSEAMHPIWNIVTLLNWLEKNDRESRLSRSNPSFSHQDV